MEEEWNDKGKDWRVVIAFICFALMFIAMVARLICKYGGAGSGMR